MKGLGKKELIRDLIPFVRVSFLVLKFQLVGHALWVLRIIAVLRETDGFMRNRIQLKYE